MSESAKEGDSPHKTRNIYPCVSTNKQPTFVPAKEEKRREEEERVHSFVSAVFEQH